LKKQKPDAEALLMLLRRWQIDAAEKAGSKVNRIVVAFEAGRDGFWLARWPGDRGIEAYTRPASQYRVNIAGRKRLGWTPHG
jgi:transposase